MQSDLAMSERREAQQWGQLAVDSIRNGWPETAASAARVAWRHALLYDAAREGRLWEA